uniref:Regulatory protein zeste n=1 Tax=Meloidogyne javanica TaxID=6303 RepID=A0A915LXE3_MELJA
MSLFTTEMTKSLAEKIDTYYDELFPSSRTSKFARRSQDAWKNITEEMNAEFGSSLSTEQVKEKHHNLKRKIKAEFAQQKSHKRATGGGEVRAEKMQTDDVFEIYSSRFGQTAAFSGIAGARSTSLTESSSGPSSQLSIYDEEPDKAEVDTPLATKPPRKIPRFDSPIAGSSITDLQRQVLEAQLSNQDKISSSLDKFNKFIDKATPILDKINKYYVTQLTTFEGIEPLKPSSQEMPQEWVGKEFETI